MVGCWRGYLSVARCRLTLHSDPTPLLAISGAPTTASPSKAENVDTRLLAAISAAVIFYYYCEMRRIQIGFTFLVLAHPGSPGQRAVKRVCVCLQKITLAYF